MDILVSSSGHRVSMWVLAVLFPLAAIPCGCDTRAYDNPLDSRNPTTAGEAPGFNAAAGDEQVTLTWSDLGIRDLAHVQILRWSAIAEVETLGAFSPGFAEWVDRSVINGETYQYRAKYVVDDDPTVHLSNTDTASPGPERIWVVDERSAGLHRIAPDGRDVVWTLEDSGYLRSLAVDEERGRVWIASGYRDEVVGIDASGTVVAVIPVEAPRKIAVYRQDGSLWVAAEWGVGRYSPSGDLLFEDRTPSNPKDVAVDQTRGTCWVAEGTGSVWIRHSDGSTAQVFGFNYPFSLSLDGSGGAWLVDAHALRVYRLEVGGAVAGWLGGFAQPVDVAAGPSGSAWVVDWDANAVVRVGENLERELTISGFNRPLAVAVDGSNDMVWVVEAYGGRVVKLSGEGERVGWSGGLDFPKDIALDLGTFR